MTRPQKLLVASFVAGLLSTGLFILERLALTDIFHGEPDLSLEWNVVSLTFLPILGFHVLSLVASGVALRATRSGRRR